MKSLALALETPHQLSQTTWFGTKTYLRCDQNGWSVVQLNLIQRIFRTVFKFFRTTHLSHIYCALSSETQRIRLDKNLMEKIETLRGMLTKKYYKAHGEVPPDWRLCFYPKYAAAFNQSEPNSFPKSVIR